MKLVLHQNDDNMCDILNIARRTCKHYSISSPIAAERRSSRTLLERAFFQPSDNTATQEYSGEHRLIKYFQERTCYSHSVQPTTLVDRHGPWGKVRITGGFVRNCPIDTSSNSILP